MKRALALTAVALVLGAGIAGCRSAGREARQPERPAAVQTSPAPPVRTSQQQAGTSAVSSDLSDVDQMLRDLDDQLAKADASPADGD
jgi:hypothetical protein